MARIRQAFMATVLIIPFLMNCAMTAITEEKYVKLLDGAEGEVKGIFTGMVVKSPAIITCGAICKTEVTCRVWSIDNRINTCRIYTFITAASSIDSGFSFFNTYGSPSIHRYFFVNLEMNSINWLDGERLCQEAGGVIAFIMDRDFMNLIFQLSNTWSAFVGVKYDVDNAAYFDFQGNLIPSEIWEDGEPRGPPKTIGQYRMSDGGTLRTTGPTYSTEKKAFCFQPDN